MNKNKEEKIILVKDCGERLSEPFIEYVKNQCKIAEDNMRKRCIEALPKKKRLLGGDWDIQDSVFNQAIDQATQNINNLDKE